MFEYLFEIKNQKIEIEKEKDLDRKKIEQPNHLAQLSPTAQRQPTCALAPNRFSSQQKEPAEQLTGGPSPLFYSH